MKSRMQLPTVVSGILFTITTYRGEKLVEKEAIEAYL